MRILDDRIEKYSKRGFRVSERDASQSEQNTKYWIERMETCHYNFGK
jgi:hypothetical protein